MTTEVKYAPASSTKRPRLVDINQLWYNKFMVSSEFSPSGVETISAEQQAQFIAAVRSVLPPMTEVLDMVDGEGELLSYPDIDSIDAEVTGEDPRDWCASDDADLRLEIGREAVGKFWVDPKSITVSEVQYSQHDQQVGLKDGVKVEVTTAEVDLRAMAAITKRQVYEADINGGAYYHETTDVKTRDDVIQRDYSVPAIRERLRARVEETAKSVGTEILLGTFIFDETKLHEVLALLRQCGPETRID